MDKYEREKIEYNRKRLIHLAKKHAKDKECPRCGNEELKVVPIHEFGDPYLPSQIIMFCPKCKKYNETIMEAPGEQARAYAEKIKEEEKGFKKAPKGAADLLIK